MKTVVIVGRPNVGKSTLFNYISGAKISIVDDRPGVTRDRIVNECEWLNRKFKLIDTGGLDLKDENIINKNMVEQIKLGIDLADVIIMVVDLKTGITDDDREIAQVVRKSKKPVILCVNKVDNFKRDESLVFEFYELGFENLFPVSSVNKQGLADMLDKVLEFLPEDENEINYDEMTKIAVIGKPNVGKSSLINKILGENRVIVSNIAGTTRDAIDTEVIKDGNKYIFIDTAGLRRKSQINDNIELYSYFRSEIAIDRCDIAIIVLDATEDISKMDTTIAGLAHDKGKGIILCINKWDLVEKDDKTMNEFTKKIKDAFSYMPYAEILFISAKTGQRVDKLYELINIIRHYQNLRIQTGTLNEVLLNAIALNDTPQDKGRRLKIYYATQGSTNPPTFVLFVNDKNLFHFTYLRYIENKFREAFLFTGTPIKFIIRERKEKDI